MKSLLLTCLVLFGLQSLQAQITVGARLGGGLMIGRAKYDASTNSQASIDLKNQPGLLLNAGLHNQYMFDGNTGIGLDLMYNYGICSDKVTTTYSGTASGSTKLTQKRYLNMFSVPLYVQQRFGKVHVNLGMQLNYFLKTKGKEDVTAIFGTSSSSTSQEFDPLSIKPIDLGIHLGCDAYLDRSFYIFASGYYGLSELNDQQSSLRSFKTMQIALGLGLKLWTESGNARPGGGHSKKRRG